MRHGNHRSRSERAEARFPQQARPRPRERREQTWVGWWPFRVVRRLITVYLCRVVLRPWLRRVIVTGRETVPPGPVIFAATHTSMTDTPLVLWALGGRADRMVVTAARDYFFHRSRPLLGVLVGVAFAAVPFDRTGFARRSLVAARAWLDKGFSLVIFPHGTIPANATEMARLHRGVAALTRLSGYAVVPVRLTGAATLLPPGVHWPRRAVVTVAFLPPLAPLHGEPLAAFTARLAMILNNVDT